MFLVHHQIFHFHNYSIDEAAAAIESIVLWSAIRRLPSDFSNEIAPSPIVRCPISAFFVFLLTFFTIQILTFEVLHNTELQNRAHEYRSMYEASSKIFFFPYIPHFHSLQLTLNWRERSLGLLCIYDVSTLFDFLFSSL